MPVPDPMSFANLAGQEMWQHLAARGQKELLTLTNAERFNALLSAALIPVAEVMRGPLEVSRDRTTMLEKLLPIAERQLRSLLQETLAGG
jgi:hypothetical protein